MTRVAPDCQPAILLAEDDVVLLTALEQVMTLHGYQVYSTTATGPALERLARGGIDVLVADVGGRDAQAMDGMVLLRAAQAHAEPPAVILITGQPTLETAVQAVAGGALQYLIKPFETRELLAAMELALQRLQGQRQLAAISVAREVRARAARHLQLHPGSTACLELALHELRDPLLYEWDDSLARYAARVFLGIRETPELRADADLMQNLQKLRRLGYRVILRGINEPHMPRLHYGRA